MDTKQNQQKVNALVKKSKGTQIHASKSPFPVELEQALIPSASNCDNTCTESSTRQTLERLCAQGFIKDWSHGQPLPNSRLAEVKQVLCIKHTACIKINRHREPLGRKWWEQKSKLPNTSQGTTLQTVLSK